MHITVVGIGYVGLANAVLLAQKNKVTMFDISKDKVDSVNKRISPFKDSDIQDYLLNKNLDLHATVDKKIAFENPHFIIIATPTNYDTEKNFFDTSTVEEVISYSYKYSPDSCIVIKSTIPLGFTAKIRIKYPTMKILFSPEFLREGKALYDNLYPSRIIIGDTNKEAKIFAELLSDSAIAKDIPVLFMTSSEAEAVKLFANTFLAMRVAFFNELDTYAEINDLDSKSIIDGMCYDPRIGKYYNNPSFGYGGYCLPKDTKQLRANYEGIPEHLISAVVQSNDARKKHIANTIISKSPKTVGIYKLAMKTESDNFRESAIHDIIKILIDEGISIFIYEPSLPLSNQYSNIQIYDFDSFIKTCDIILTNRKYPELNDYLEKIYTRDIYCVD